jgi:hypothetical protein
MLISGANPVWTGGLVLMLRLGSVLKLVTYQNSTVTFRSDSLTYRG